MQLLLSLLAILALSVLGTYGRLVKVRTALGLEQLVDSGFLFLFAGIALGSAGAGLITTDVIRQLDPLLTLGLGVFGFLLGLELHVFKLRGLEGRLLLAAGVESLITLFVVAVPMLGAMELLAHEPFRLRLFTGLMVGAAAAISSGKALATIERRRPAPGRDRIMRVADLDCIFVVLCSGVVLGLLPREGRGAALSLWSWALATAAIGVLCGLAAWLLLPPDAGGETSSQLKARAAEQLVFLGGTLLLCAGAASYLRLSPAAAGLIAGMTLAHLPGEAKTKVQRLLEPLEHPLAIVFLLIGGASWTLASLGALALLPLYLLFRTAGKVAGGSLAARISGVESAARLPYGLLSPGVLAIGLALNYQMAFPASVGGIGQAAVAVIIAGSVCSEIAAALTARAPKWKES